MASDEERGTTFNPKRRLCPDGSCIGIIGSAGRCSACGRAAAGQPSETETGTAPPLGEDAVVEEALGIETDGGEASGPAFDPQRRLCGDDACVGVIGTDGRCSVCGRPA